MIRFFIGIVSLGFGLFTSYNYLLKEREAKVAQAALQLEVDKAVLAQSAIKVEADKAALGKDRLELEREKVGIRLAARDLDQRDTKVMSREKDLADLRRLIDQDFERLRCREAVVQKREEGSVFYALQREIVKQTVGSKPFRVGLVAFTFWQFSRMNTGAGAMR